MVRGGGTGALSPWESWTPRSSHRIRKSSAKEAFVLASSRRWGHEERLNLLGLGTSTEKLGMRSLNSVESVADRARECIVYTSVASQGIVS